MLYTDTIEPKSSCSQAERIAGGRRNYEPTARKKAEKGISIPSMQKAKPAAVQYNGNQDKI